MNQAKRNKILHEGFWGVTLLPWTQQQTSNVMGLGAGKRNMSQLSLIQVSDIKVFYKLSQQHPN